MPRDGIAVLQAVEETQKKDRHEHPDRAKVNVAFCHVAHWDFSIAIGSPAKAESRIALGIQYIGSKCRLVGEQKPRRENMNHRRGPQAAIFVRKYTWHP